MKKTVRSVLSFALALCLVLSLGVAAFADDSSKTDKDKDKEPETINIFFNLATMEPCALRMRTLEYDDIRLNGISYRADAEDGVLSIELADLAAAKLLTEYKDEAEKAGIDFDKIYIRGGKIYVKEDIGLSSDEISTLKTAIKTFMSSKSIGVNIGDTFELSNGDEVKFKVKVVNFVYPQQKKETMKIQTVTDEDTGDKDSKFFKMEKKTETIETEDGKVTNSWYEPTAVKTPAVTTILFHYDVVDSYAKESSNDKTPSSSPPVLTKTTSGNGYIGIAKAKDDTNDYYIQINFASDKDNNMSSATKGAFVKATDLTTTESTYNEYAVDEDDNPIIDENGEQKIAKKGFWDSLLSLFKRDEDTGNITEVANNVKISTDKDGKNIVRDIDIKNTTPSTLEEIKKEADKKDGDYSKGEMFDSNGNEIEDAIMYVPDDFSKVTKDDGTKAEIEVNNRATEACMEGHTWQQTWEPTQSEMYTDEYVDVLHQCTKCGATKLVRFYGTKPREGTSESTPAVTSLFGSASVAESKSVTDEQKEESEKQEEKTESTSTNPPEKETTPPPETPTPTPTPTGTANPIPTETTNPSEPDAE